MASGRTNGSGRAGTFLTAARREADLDAIAASRFDLLVVGGGVTGTGAALDAAARGLSVLLLERADLATGTSRWSSKFAHGGLRYLAGGHVGVAWQSARERATLLDVTAPHLVRPLPMLFPVRRDGSLSLARRYELGVRAGDALRALAGTSGRRLPRARRVTASEARGWVPAVASHDMRRAVLHWDCQIEDDARLVVALARTAAGRGARVVTYADVLSVHADGARVRDALSGVELDVWARHVINATGVWASALAPAVALRPSRGSHLLVSAARLGNPRAALSVPVPGDAGRFVFAAPRPDGLVLVGLTDEPFGETELPDAPPVTEADESFLLAVLSRALELPVTRADVVGRFAGLRPLLDAEPGRTADLSRRHAVIEDPSSGVVTIVGGKLTTFRLMAQDAVDRVASRPGVEAGPCRTRRLPLVGAQSPQAVAPSWVPRRLVRRYGAEAEAVASLAAGRPELLEPIAPGVPALGVELLAAVRWEGALTLDDALDRRTRLALVPAWREAAAAAAERIVPELVEVSAGRS